jgi:SAM-dependent methyltransferase
MDRRERITKYITREQRGIEVGPWWNPLAPRRLGYNTLNLDTFPDDVLRIKAELDQNIPREAIQYIEVVDLIGSANNIAEIVETRYTLGEFDYIVSSHNFEHLPDPIKFLSGCAKVLKSEGILSMAIPDRRGSYDYFRPHSTTAELLEANFARRNRPTAAQIFAQSSLHCLLFRDGQGLCSFSLTDDPRQIVPLETLEDAYCAWLKFEDNPDDIYFDVHCWVFTPSSFELIFRDLRFLRIVPFELVSIEPTSNGEFYVHLRNERVNTNTQSSPAEFYERRAVLLRRAHDEAA